MTTSEVSVGEIRELGAMLRMAKSMQVYVPTDEERVAASAPLPPLSAEESDQES